MTAYREWGRRRPPPRTGGRSAWLGGALKGVRFALSGLARGLAAVLILACLAVPGALAQDAPSPATPATPNQSLAPPAATPTPAAPIPDFLRPISEWDALLDRIDILVSEPAISERTLIEARRDLAKLVREIGAHLAQLEPRLAAARAQAERLGTAPAAGQPAEVPIISGQRATLQSTVTNLSGAINAAEAATVRAGHLANRIRERRRLAFLEDVLQRVPSVFSPELWRQVAADVPGGMERLGIILADWAAITDQGRLSRLLAAALALGAGLSLAAWRGILRYRRWDEADAPPEWRRAASAAWVIAMRVLPTLAVVSAIMAGLTAWQPLPGRLERLTETALFALTLVVVVQAVGKTVLAINRPHWRLVRLSNAAARKLHLRVLLLALFYSADLVASALNDAANVPFSLGVARSFMASLVFAGVIISILLIRAPSFDARRPAQRIGPAWFRLPLWLLAIAILTAAFLGYVTLARFIAGQLIVITTILIVTYLFLVWSRAFGKSLSDDRTRLGIWLRGRLGLEKRRREQIALPITLLLQTVIIVAAIPFMLLQWGSDWQDVADMFRAALFGFDIGGARISVLTVAAAILVFAVGYIAAKIFQGWIDSQVMEPAGVEPALRHSIRTGVGYLGIGLALLAALAHAGLDISSLAIVAGALSVGIGFGLQGVVNNFLSGLILLAERPIKVGDWIIVGEDEGIVRRISVRSTEIETFERSSVIVPNAMLIAEKVKNWTLHNNTGRYTVKVAVHFDSDPERVRDILLEIARAHPQILSTPEPFVYLEEFGAHALNFTLYVYLANVSRSFAVRTDLRVAILKAFRAAGIEIPYPQADIHFRDLGWVKSAITERIAKGAGAGAGAPPVGRDFVAESGLANDGDGE